MLTADQEHAVKKLVPQVQLFVAGVPKQHHPDTLVYDLLSAAFEEGYVTGLINIEKFELGNVEGIRVQVGHTYKYFRVKSEGR